jgi:hypothetical protein
MLTTDVSKKWVGKCPLHFSLYCFVSLNIFTTKEQDALEFIGLLQPSITLLLQLQSLIASPLQVGSESVTPGTLTLTAREVMATVTTCQPPS